MEVLIALIICITVFSAIAFVTCMIRDYYEYKTTVESQNIGEALKEIVEKAEVQVINTEKKEAKKTPGRKKKVEEDK